MAKEAICISDEISVDLRDSNPRKATDIGSAVDGGNIDGLTKLLKEVGQKNPIVFVFGSNSLFKFEPFSVLHDIAYNGNLEMFKMVSNTLTDLQPKSKSGTRRGATPLHYAGQQGHLPIVRFILNCIKDSNPPDSIGRTVMHYAAEEGQLDVIKFYAEKLKTGVNPPDGVGDTIIDVAITKGNLNIIKFYIEYLKKNNLDINPCASFMRKAVVKGQIDIIKFCVNKLKEQNLDINPNDIGVTVMYDAAKEGQTDIVKFYLDELKKSNLDINPSTGLSSVMHVAAMKGHLDIINIFLRNLKDKNPPLQGIALGTLTKLKGFTPLHLAARFGHLEVVKAITKVLLDKNPSDYHGVTPFHEAAQEGRLPVVEYLVRYVNDLDIQSGEYYNKKTPLMYASKYGHLNVVKYLIEEGANPKLTSSENKTAYDIALESDGDFGNLDENYDYDVVDNSEVLEYLQQFN